MPEVPSQTLPVRPAAVLGVALAHKDLDLPARQGGKNLKVLLIKEGLGFAFLLHNLHTVFGKPCMLPTEGKSD